MDEILIGEKKYISSKQAAKVTGYAKDYIGQLCREGRVPARLVGRSWYVLESAIADHRFEGVKNKPAEASHPTAESLESTWESPRYSASSVETLPPINRLEDREGSVDPEVRDEHEVVQHLQDSWKAWFDRVADSTPSVDLASLAVPEEQEEVVETPQKEEEVPISIRTVYELPPKDLLPSHHVVVHPSRSDESEGEPQRVLREKKGGMWVVRVGGAVLAMVVAAFAVVGTGYFDGYIISNSQVSWIAGVGVYNK